ncbi:MAG: TraR/DksA C4-type zinc finger protein [Myxococcota bacterium]
MSKDHDDSAIDELDAKTLEYFRGKLTAARDELLERNRSRLSDVLDHDEVLNDEADHAEADRAQQFELRLADKDRKLLRLIEHALGKIDIGEYGLCEGTGELIPRARLELRPWARYSVEHKMTLERDRALHAGG